MERKRGAGVEPPECCRYLVAHPGRPQEAAEAENWTAGRAAEPRRGWLKTMGSARITSLGEGPGYAPD